MTHVRKILGLFAVLTTVALAASCGGDSGSTTVTPVEPPAPQNRAPTAVGSIGAVTVDVGATVTTDVASNFSDPDGDALTYSAATSDGGVATATVSGSVVSTTGVAAGSATVTITARDPGGLSATQTMAVTVNATNSAPEVTGTIDDQTLSVGDSVTVDVAGNFSDPDGDDLTFAAASSDTAVATASVSGSMVTVMAVAAGSATVTVTATDTGGLEAEAGFTVTVEQPNRAPEVAEAIPAQTMNVGDTVKLIVPDYFTDPDGDELSYEAVSADTDVAEALAMGDTVMIAAMSAGQATVAVTATDPEGLMASQDVSVTVQGPQNQAPSAVDSIPAHDLVVDSAVVLDMAAYFADADGDELTYSVSSSDETVAVSSAEGSMVTTMGISAMEEDTVRMATLMVTATDPEGLSATQEADVFVATMDHEVLTGLTIGTEGENKGKLQFSVIGALPSCFPKSLVDRFLSANASLMIKEIHWTEWQIRKGTGWVRVPGTRLEPAMPTDDVICPYQGFEDGTAPAGTYRVVGEVTIEEEGKDPVRVRRKTENEYVHNPES